MLPQNRFCIITPINKNDSFIDQITNMWKEIGMKIEVMDPERHDRVLAMTSHIPQLIAFSVVTTATELESHMKDEFTLEMDGTIDVSQAIEQYLIIETPFNTLCSNDCKGLCQQCGANLNQGECSCAPRLSDPAWENLRDLWENKTKQV